MKKIIHISLSGHPATFPLDEAGDAALQSYLDRARTRLEHDPDREEVLRDLEQSIAEKLACLPDLAGRTVRRDEVASTLDEIGAVDTDSAGAGTPEGRITRRRRLYRITEGRWLAGICQGLAAYSSIRVGWVRFIVVLLVIFTSFLSLSIVIAWIPVLAYIALTFILPVARTRDDYFFAQ